MASLVHTAANRVGESLADSKLALVEFFLACDEAEECAQRALEWAGEHIGLSMAVCLSVEANQLRGMAAVGASLEQVRKLWIDLDDLGHPLVVALRSRQAVVLDPQEDVRWDRSLGFLHDLLMVIPLPLAAKSDSRVGLLLASLSTNQSSRDLRWLADALGQKILRLQNLNRLASAETQLSRERTLLHRVINAVPDPIVLTDMEGRIIVANSRAEALFGASEEESEGRRRAVALNNMLFSAALSQRVLEDSSSVRRELPLVDPTEGGDLLFELLSTVAADPREGTGIVSILRNVTDLRRATEEIQENYRRLHKAEAEIRAERDRLDLIIDSVADPILVTDPSGNIVLMNSPAESLFTLQQGAGEEAMRTVRANDAHFSSFISNLFFGGRGMTLRGDVSLVHPHSGEPIPMEANSGKVISEHGEVTAVVTILHDRREALEKALLYEELKSISEQLEVKVADATAELVRQNELLRRQHLELEQASQLKSQFLANMSHEFRTPLNAILGYTSMLLHGVAGELTPPQRRHAERVDANSHHLLSIINDILDISRIEAGKMPVHRSRFDLGKLVAEVMAEAEPLIVRSGIEVKAEKLGSVELNSDRQKVKQILLNLLSNALKFTPRGWVKISSRVTPREVRVAVTDTGIGVNPEDREKIFQDFRQADNSPTREYGGAGLGLSICRRLANMLGGDIHLESQVGKGSTFTLTLARRGKGR